MNLREYFKEVAKELEGVRTPENFNTSLEEKAIDFIFECYELNRSPNHAAELLVARFGYGQEKKAH